MFTTTTRVLTLPHGQVRVHERGPPSAPAVVLLHGWMSSGAVFADVLPALSAPDRHVVWLDQRGTVGAADGYGIADYGGDVIAVLDALDVERAVLVGHSMGGQVALWLGATYPERVAGICALNPVPLSGLMLPEAAASLFASSAGDAHKQRMILQMATVSLSPASLQGLLEVAGAVEPACIVGALAAFLAGSDVDVGLITAPTLVLSTDDPFLPPPFLQRSIVDAIAGARLQHLPGAGHYPTVEKPKETAAIINDFLRSLSPATSPSQQHPEQRQRA
jgi:pimeloyl-ACP methyl ester carboxylesterase